MAWHGVQVRGAARHFVAATGGGAAAGEPTEWGAVHGPPALVGAAVDDADGGAGAGLP